LPITTFFFLCNPVYLPLDALIMERQIIEKEKHPMWIIGLGYSKVGSGITDSVNVYSLSEKNMIS